MTCAAQKFDAVGNEVLETQLGQGLPVVFKWNELLHILFA